MYDAPKDCRVQVFLDAPEDSDEESCREVRDAEGDGRLVLAPVAQGHRGRRGYADDPADLFSDCNSLINCTNWMLKYSSCAYLITMRTLTASTLSKGYRPIGRQEANNRSTFRKAKSAMCYHRKKGRNLELCVTSIFNLIEAN